MGKYKITGYVKCGFEKIVECESFEAANKLANLIEYTEDVDSDDINDWVNEVEVEDVEELEE
nr:MAG TPA: hypothetical protein [Caudoviricetes sp.]